MQDKKQDILEYLQKIPKGKVMTYKSLADVFEVHPRKIAMTMKYNKYTSSKCYYIFICRQDRKYARYFWSRKEKDVRQNPEKY